MGTAASPYAEHPYHAARRFGDALEMRCFVECAHAQGYVPKFDFIGLDGDSCSGQ
jgi:hypothetical protein